MKKFIGLLLLGIGISASSESAVFYVRDTGPTANCGNDWTTACDSLSNFSSLIRGSTYYVADGNYSSYTFNNIAGSSQIIIKKAVAGMDHGPAADWLDSYGVGQATFGEIVVKNTNAIVVDGQKDKGFLISYGAGGSGFQLQNTQNFSILNVEIVGPGVSYIYGPGGNAGTTVGIYVPAYYTAANILVRNVKNHDTSNAFWIAKYSSNITIERSEIYNIGAGDEDDGKNKGAHSNLAYLEQLTNLTFRYNNVYNYRSTGLYPSLDGEQSTGWKIYGNVFHDSIAFVLSTGRGHVRAEFFNNTIYNVGGENNIINMVHALPGTEFTNNIFWNVGPISYNIASSSHNYYISGRWGVGDGDEVGKILSNIDPTVGNGNFHLKPGSLAINAGKLLPAEFNTDADGLVRGASNTAWDMGAYEYGSSVPSTSHPADTNSDYLMALNEATKYGACWKNPAAFGDCPAGIAIDYAVRAGTMWAGSANGQYQYNSGNTCPLCWEIKP